MDYEPEIISPFLAIGKKALSPEALSTLRIMAFLDPKHLQKGLFEPLRQLFAMKNEELTFNFPTTAAAHTEACAELVNASLIQLSEEDGTFCMTPEIQTRVLADLQPTGLIPPLFNAMVKVLTELWPQIICVPDGTLDQKDFTAVTVPGTDYEVYLSQTPQLLEYVQYARVNVWDQRDELVHCIARLEQIFYHFDDNMVELCATITFAMLLTEASWCAIS